MCRVTADEGHIGSAHRARFQDVETRSPVILTTSQLLTTGVDAPTCKNVVLARVVGSMPEFKQIIGRGTRLRTDYGKLAFNIIDYTGTATEKFADPDFDGVPLHEAGRRHRPGGRDGRGTSDSGAGARSLSPVPGPRRDSAGGRARR